MVMQQTMLLLFGNLQDSITCYTIHATEESGV